MLSKEYGWQNNISPEIMSHPANCQFLINEENMSKGEKFCITLEHLYERTDNKDFSPVTKQYFPINRGVSEWIRKLSETNKKYIIITNGYKNKRILKYSKIPPDGWRRGKTNFT